MSIALHHIRMMTIPYLFGIGSGKRQPRRFPSAVLPFPDHAIGLAASGTVLIFTAPLSGLIHILYTLAIHLSIVFSELLANYADMCYNVYKIRFFAVL